MLLINCKSSKTKYEKGICGKNINRYCPFSLNVEKIKINGDTLYLSIDVINMKHKIEILDKKLFCSIMILYDTAISRGGFSILHYTEDPILNYDERGRQLITCDNCFEELQKSSNFAVLSMFDKYTFVKKHHILNLDKMPIGYQFYINYAVETSYYSSKYCPSIWSGLIQIVTKITK